jgi:hypothetical protein
MKPIAYDLTNFSDFESDLRNDLSDGHVIGFLLDSRLGELKKSGLILHPYAVIPLDILLGQRATLFYPDPLRFKGKAYLEAVRDFSQKLLVSEHIRYEVELPALLLMTYQDGVFKKIRVLSLDTKTMCMWHGYVYAFIEEYLGSHLPRPQQDQGWKRMIKEHAGSIAVDSVKACVGILFSKIISLG